MVRVWPLYADAWHHSKLTRSSCMTTHPYCINTNALSGIVGIFQFFPIIRYPLSPFLSINHINESNHCPHIISFISNSYPSITNNAKDPNPSCTCYSISHQSQIEQPFVLLLSFSSYFHPFFAIISVDTE
eukprot:107211_1